MNGPASRRLPPLPDPGRTRARFVAKGEYHSVTVQGGFAQHVAEVDGVQVDVGDACGFIPWTEIVALKRGRR
jgi:hypothetical protein